MYFMVGKFWYRIVTFFLHRKNLTYLTYWIRLNTNVSQKLIDHILNGFCLSLHKKNNNFQSLFNCVVLFRIKFFSSGTTVKNVHFEFKKYSIVFSMFSTAENIDLKKSVQPDLADKKLLCQIISLIAMLNFIKKYQWNKDHC